MIFEPYRPNVPANTAPPPARAPEGSPDAAEYVSHEPWSVERPAVLVIACSDGRLRHSTDDFLINHLGITTYDRLYVPGGPGGLAGGGAEFTRAGQMLNECRFLINAHGTNEVILIFHGAADDGPEEAVCADYRRKYGDRRRVQEMQDLDLKELMRHAFTGPAAPRLRAFRADVDGRHNVRFTRIDGGA